MPKSQQIIKRIEFHQLKNLKNLTIDFDEKPLTAIFGPNGSGKSTILHALCCINNPVSTPVQTVNYRLSDFFTPTTHSVWDGSSFTVYQSYREGINETGNHVSRFRKQRKRWEPRYGSRIERYVSYIGIRTCVPRIESETQKALIQFNTTPLTDSASNTVKVLAGEVMNRNYSLYNEHQAWAKKYIGVIHEGINYSSLSMGAGEQRIFYILSEVVKSPNHGLIIIDEIDLLLHQDALIRLLEKLNHIASQKKLQIIFTSHAQSILELDFIAVRHLYQTPDKTLCFTQTKPDALQRLSGKQLRPLEIFVEDDLAYALIKKICSLEGLAKYVSVREFGAAINCFTSVAGSILNNLTNQENMLFVLDGDEYSTEKEKKEKIGKVLTGTTPNSDIQRSTALQRITQFTLPIGAKPEKYYHSLICQLQDANLSEDQREIVKVAREIGNPGDSHRYFDDIIIRMDYSRDVGLSKLVDILALTNNWNEIVSNISVWLYGMRDSIIEA